ncbi:uncharacterized protein LOC124895156 [Capsicum annuum]|uniref:uncharacterized protein LOC124895156 n=1 Tax=Capsicum annuum TaxID=4072 RepID=UPI001FB08067|nr:uncharacterized protein LOC124895156 [Capsicum annuum]
MGGERKTELCVHSCLLLHPYDVGPGESSSGTFFYSVAWLFGSRSTLFAATDPQISEYCEMLKADDWPVCAYISHDCRPTNASEEAHNVETSYEVWEKTLELVGLPSDAVERLIEGEEIINPDMEIPSSNPSTCLLLSACTGSDCIYYPHNLAFNKVVIPSILLCS